VEDTWRACKADGVLSRQQLNERYAASMEEAARRFSAHDHVLFLAADALMNLSPWDYWEDGHRSERIRPSAKRARDLLETVMARSPDHAGALHLFIHLTEAGPHPEDALQAAERLGNLLPGSPHLRHMPSHTFIRMGHYQESAHSNERALELPLVQHVYPQHNLDFLVYSLRMLGRSEAAWEAATTLSRYAEALLTHYGHPSRTPLEATFPAERFVVAQLQCAVVFRRADFALQVPEPPAPRFFQRAFYHWARGFALLQRAFMDGALVDVNAKRTAGTQATAELVGVRAALAELEAQPSSTQYYGGTYPAAELMRIGELELSAELARFGVLPQESGSESELLQRALVIEQALTYDEPPSQHFPVAHRLGAALLRDGQLAAAERCYRDSLAYFHNDGWALFGLWQVQRAAQQSSADTKTLFRNAWRDSDVQLVDSAFVRV
jgi:tetratricopeptide (TPR) repeat protein